ncbi:AraC family transcriptional regulator [Dyella telluris]|uniref:AraC family transcriptional regulator n=1 Tax=Dyella telluris TaxID=2763498 RepID=A0A7G8Q1N0_9GAMM|nr:helix-turn-helix domain-containing protein [Dyella telluris]QNK00688.1 AraC family transcriptional regulator [Dyella telluris]
MFGQGCGVLHHSLEPDAYRHTRYGPPAELARWVEHFWLEQWDLGGRAPQARVVLPHPCVHLVFAPGRSRCYGVQLKRFARELKDQGRILGIKFRPGAFYPFFHQPVSAIANSAVPAGQVFPNAGEGERRVLACSDDLAMVAAAAAFLSEHLPADDPNVGTVCDIVEAIAGDAKITRVEQLVARFDLQERTLQRLFQRYVGASARWVIKRYRIYDVLARLTAGEPIDWATLAQDMGYFDQSHLYNDFRKLVGCSPGQYLPSGS